MCMNTPYEAYNQKQESIYQNMREISASVGVTEGIETDPGTEPQAAFLVAWRHPEHITEQVEEFSLSVGGLYRAIT